MIRTQINRHNSYVANPFLSSVRKQEQTVVNLADWTRAAG
jgi:hypothetical protein